MEQKNNFSLLSIYEKMKKIKRMFYLGLYQRDQTVINKINPLFIPTNKEPTNQLLVIQKSFLVLNFDFLKCAPSFQLYFVQSLAWCPFCLQRKCFFP